MKSCFQVATSPGSGMPPDMPLYGSLTARIRLDLDFEVIFTVVVQLHSVSVQLPRIFPPNPINKIRVGSSSSHFGRPDPELIG